ncbi:MAG: HEAT repeat domain-containing protein [Labilithrix sp.]|nr:HEAT repeat domain-containing protein [Labilithrix sp.]
MDETLTRLAFRVQGGDVEAARALLLEAQARQHAPSFDRAARAKGGGAAILAELESAIDERERARVRELLPPPAEAAAMFTPAAVDLEAIDRVGPAALVATARWAIEGLHAVPRYGTGLPYLGAALAGPWLHVQRAFGGRVEAPWVALRVVVALDPAKKALTDAIVKSFFTTFQDRAAVAVETLLAHETPPVRRLLWAKLLLDHPERVDDPSLCALLDDAPTRELAVGLLVRRGPAAAKHALPLLQASAPGTRRAVAGLLALLGDHDAIPILRQAISRERDARTRVHMTSALEKLSGAEPLVPKATGEDTLVARTRAALAAPRQPKPPAWLAAHFVITDDGPRVAWRDGEPVTRAEIDALAGRLALLRATHVDAIVPDVRRALEPKSARTLIDAIRAAFVASQERHRFPDWILRAIAHLLSEAGVDAACEEIDRNLRTSARERWRRGTTSEVELVWDPDAIAASPCRVAFAWLVHWSETGPKRRDREKAQKALAVATRAVPESERPFAYLRRFGLDDGGARRFLDGDRELVVRVRHGGAIEVTDASGEPVVRLPSDELGHRVKLHVASVEEALLEARRTLAEAYADKLTIEVRFVRRFLLTHPLWRPIVLGCVVRREGAPSAVRLGEEALTGARDHDRVRFVLAQVES